MAHVTVLILAPDLAPDAGPLRRLVNEAWSAMAEWHRDGFLAAGANCVEIRREPPDDTPFGARLRRLIAELELPGGLVVLGAGALPLARPADRRDFIVAAASKQPFALANHHYSADAIAIAGAAGVLRQLPDLRSDNALPRWLDEVAGVPVSDLRRRRRLAMDIDSPLDLLLLEGAEWAPTLPLPGPADADAVRIRLAQLRLLADDPAAELLVTGRTSARDIRWLELRTRSRTRAIIEERGLRTSLAGAQLGRPNRRQPRSILGTLLDRDGWNTLGSRVAGLSDGALVDSRVLLAHRHGADERRWPSAEDRFASDLLLPDRVADPWLRALTAAAASAEVPILLGGHSLVGPGLRLALRRGPTARPDGDGSDGSDRGDAMGGDGSA